VRASRISLRNQAQPRNSGAAGARPEHRGCMGRP